ncbi:MAG: NifB/NifX family molybdenum-iron cluster-binding protein [Halobacteriota archaeon]
MKICVTAAAGDLNARVHWEFGRSRYFVIVDPDTMAFEAVPNKSRIDETGKAFCIAHPETLLNKGVDLVISGNIGPNIYHMLHTAGVDIATLTAGTVKEAVEMYKSGGLSIIGAPIPRRVKEEISMLEARSKSLRQELEQVEKRLGGLRK